MKKNPYQGKFIVFEGLDGSGQTTQVKFLESYLARNGYRVVSTKEPTQESEAGKEIKEILNHKKRISASRLQELFAQDRREHLEGFIIPALKEGKIVSTDIEFPSVTYPWLRIARKENVEVKLVNAKNWYVRTNALALPLKSTCSSSSRSLL